MRKAVHFNQLITGIIAVLSLGCAIEPQPINYGVDMCHFCKMTIVDKIHGSEMVTKKGKVYKFDALECLVNYRKEIDTNTIALKLTNHFSKAEELINAKSSYFLISENLPSPMGAYLTAFKDSIAANEILAQKGGKIYTWKELLEKFEK